MVFSGCDPSFMRNETATAPPPADPNAWRRPWSDEDVKKPEWIADATRGGKVLGAYGTAQHDPYVSRATLRDRAMLSARSELASIVRSRVQTVFKAWLAEDQGASKTFAESTSRSIADQSIEGAAQRDEWVHPKTSELFIWVVVDPSYTRNLAKTMAEAASAASTGNPTLDAHLRAKAGSDAGFAELDRLLKEPANR
jgi:hypothetical protein